VDPGGILMMREFMRTRADRSDIEYSFGTRITRIFKRGFTQIQIRVNQRFIRVICVPLEIGTIFQLNYQK
jgi:hypothetical protein